MTNFIESLATLKDTYKEIYLVIAPPRTSSTAFARVLWNHPAVNLYSHEPFDRVYHRQNDLMSVIDALSSPARLTKSENKENTESLVIKEMTFQVGEYFSSLAKMTKRPVIFLIRDPRMSILSRMKKRKEGGQTPVFPIVESGWHDLQSQIMFCKQNAISYCIIDSKDFRNHPEQTFKMVLERLGLSFSQEIFSWKPMDSLALGSISDEQSHWYNHVQQSITIEPETEIVPEMETSEDSDFQAHIEQAIKIYKELSEDSETLKPNPL